MFYTKDYDIHFLEFSSFNFQKVMASAKDHLDTL